MHLRLTPLKSADARRISGWWYPPPYDPYNVPAQDAARMADPAQRFSAIRDGDELIAYACLGGEARVRGLDPQPGTEDLGFALRPDLMGQGLSRQTIPWLLQALRDQIAGHQLRVVILDWNLRSLAAYRRAGFSDAGSHTNEDGTFLLLTRPSRPRGPLDRRELE
jgi:ribosomal-protein-alanine N-acetyltransferase